MKFFISRVFPAPGTPQNSSRRIILKIFVLPVHRERIQNFTPIKSRIILEFQIELIFILRKEWKKSYIYLSAQNFLNKSNIWHF